MNIRVPVQKKILLWAEERSGLPHEVLRARFPKMDEWISGSVQPTMKQLESFASYTRTPIGYLMLADPPVENLPIPDFRTMPNAMYIRPSPDLLETIYICQQRQDWYRDFALETGESGLPFVGKATLQSDIQAAAADIRAVIGLDIDERKNYPTWTDALRGFIGKADDAGILVMCSGVVLNNNTRRLQPEEFRGFALSDSFAPLVFINGADTKAAQMFTLAHELSHIWLGSTALSDLPPENSFKNETEKWCNQVAAEILVPLRMFKDAFNGHNDLDGEINRLARQFKVSTLVIIRRIREIGLINQDEFWKIYRDEEARLRDTPKGSGGNFFLTQAARASKRFSRALVISTLEGNTLHRDAFHFLGLTKVETFTKLGHSLGVL